MHFGGSHNEIVDLLNEPSVGLAKVFPIEDLAHLPDAAKRHRRDNRFQIRFAYQLQ
jgi:hypothetical protein